MGKGAPPPPDYTGAASAQAAGSLANTNQQTFNNRPDVYTPWGSVTWDRPAAPQTPVITGQDYWGKEQNSRALDAEKAAVSSIFHGSDANQAQGAKMLDQWKQTYEHEHPDYAGMGAGGAGGGAGGLGNWVMHLNLSPEQQAALNDQQKMQSGRSGLALGLMDTAKNEVNTPFDWGGLPQVGNGMDARNRAENAIYNRETSRLDPMWKQKEQQTRSSLINQGLDPGSQAYTTGMGDFGRARNDAYQGATNESIMGGGQEMSRQFQQDSQARQQAIAEMFQKKYGTLNAMNALMAGQQVQNPQFPSFNQAGGAQSANLLGAAQAQGQFGMDSSNMANNLWGSALSGLGSAVGMIL